MTVGRDKWLRVLLVLLPFVFNSGAVLFLLGALRGDVGIWIKVFAVAFMIGLVVNPIRLPVTLLAECVREKRDAGEETFQVSPNWWNSYDCWKQVLVQTAVIAFLEVQVGIDLLLWLILGFAPSAIWFIGELVVLGIIAYRKRRWLNSITESIDRAIRGLPAFRC